MPEITNLKIRSAAPPLQDHPAESHEAYAELSVMSNFSFLEGASHPDELIHRAAELGYKAIAITDRNSLAGAVRMHVAAKRAGLKLLIGARLTFVDAPDILTWVTDRAAYARLCRLLTLGRRRAPKGECQLYLSDLLDYEQGLLLAVIPPTDLENEGWIDSLRLLRSAVGDRLSLAASCLHNPRGRSHLSHLAEIARNCDVPILATNDVCYHEPSRRMLQDALTCIRTGCTIHAAGYRLFPNSERYLKSPQQMHRQFADYPQAIRRTIELANRCHFTLDELRYEYPDELVPASLTPIEHLGRLTWQGAAERYPQGIPPRVVQRIEHELQLIQQLNFEPYFLTVHDIVTFARSKAILCQGRGSAANSAVCYCLGVTSVDPDRIDVLFERFISAARNEPPDIDIDFEHERREEVIQYIYEKYGRECAGMTATVITYRGRSAVRDIGKAMGLSLDLVDEMAGKLDWWDKGVVTDQRLSEIGLDPSNRMIRLVIDLTTQLLGFPRHLSQHVGGMVMTRGPLCELVPIENASMEERTVIEWDKDDIDALNILKVDVLALGMLTCISKCIALLNEQRLPDQPRLELYNIPAEDPAVYEMISNADTVGVFQIESRAQMSMLPRLRPNTFYDLVIEVAIVRPGPIQGDMVHPYLRRRNGEEPVEFPSEALRQVLGKTLGVPLFQEQAMKVAMVAAGFSADEADQLRRAMAAWRYHGSIDKFQRKMIDGMLANGYTLDFAERCFNQIKGFGEYGFPESHAASFALLVYASSWIKCHHPAVFACGLLNSQPMGFYAPAQIVRDAKDHGVTVLPADVNHSDWDCTLEYDNADAPALRLGFRMIKGFSALHAQSIVSSRLEDGHFQSVEAFHRRTTLPSHAIQRLAHADAMGSLNLTRRESLWDVLALSDVPAPLFTECDELSESSPALPLMPIRQEVMTDYATCGLSLKQHPVALLRDQLSQRRVISAAELMKLPQGRWANMAGLVLIRQRPGTAKGIVFVTLEDETGVVNLIIRPDVYERCRSAARHATLLQADGYVERQGQVVHLLAKRLHDLSEWLEGCTQKSRDFH